MASKPELGFKIWTAVLSVFVALLLFPNLVNRRGVWRSILITALAVGPIWLMYFVIGQLISWAVSEELKRRSREHSGDKKGSSGKPPLPTGLR